jgi:serine/threonine-protein kinase HipA
MHGIPTGILIEHEKATRYTFTYLPGYESEPISLALPVQREPYEFTGFPPFFEGLLPEGIMLEGLLRTRKIDRTDCFSQLVAVGGDMPGAITVEVVDETLPDHL